jgi:hypothetical protein
VVPLCGSSGTNGLDETHFFTSQPFLAFRL